MKIGKIMVFVKTWGYKIECETRGNISCYYNLSYDCYEQFHHMIACIDGEIEIERWERIGLFCRSFLGEHKIHLVLYSLHEVSEMFIHNGVDVNFKGSTIFSIENKLWFVRHSL